MAGKTLKIAQLLVSAGTAVTCPKCEHEFSLEEGFAKKALESLEQGSASALAGIRDAERAEAEKRALELASQQDLAVKAELAGLKKLLEDQAAAHAKAMADVQTLAAKSVAPQIQALQSAVAERDAQLKSVADREAAIKAREHGLAAQIEAGAAERAAGLVAADKRNFEMTLQASQEQVKALRIQEVALLKEKGELADRAAALELENARKLNEEREAIAAKARVQEQERGGLEKAELQKKLDDLSGQLVDAQRKIAQGSQQLQGEVLELAIEEDLRRTFPSDTIEEVKKGQRGGDILHHVKTQLGQVAGIILWETKRAKDWQAPWTLKLKEDMRMSGAAVGILVTMPLALPKDWREGDHFALYDDVWVTQFSTALGLAHVLRESLVGIHKQRLVSAGKGEKMEALYDYLTSPQFAQKLKAVYRAFEGMQEDLQKERSAAEQRYARREKQIQSGMKELLGFAGDVQGLSHQDLPNLELVAPVKEGAEG